MTSQETLIRLGRDIPGLTVATLIGGVAVAENVKSLIGGCHVAVGTPGRVRFLMNKGLLRASTAETLVLDSADWLMAPVFQASGVLVRQYYYPQHSCVFCARSDLSQRIE